jgi:hypothetical protein
VLEIGQPCRACQSTKQMKMPTFQVVVQLF